MATYTVGSGGDYTGLQSCLLSGVLAAGDTVQILAGHSQVESVGLGVTWPDNLIVQGDISDPSNAVLEWDNPTSASDSWVLLINNGATGVTFRGLTINYTGPYTTYSTCYRGGWAGHSGITFEDCRLASSGNYGMRVVGAGFVLRRCRVDNSPNTTSTTTIGMYSGTCTVESSLFLGWTRYSMVASTATITNTTVYSNKAPALLNPYGLSIYITANGTTIANCIVQTVNSVNYNKGIAATSPGTTGTLKNSIISGFYADVEAAGFTQTNVTTTGGIGTNPVLTDPAGGDFYPANPGLAYHTGDPSSIPAGGDLTRRAFNNPPSMGALEVIPPTPPSTLTVSGVFVVPPPNVTSISTLNIPHTLSAPSQIKDIYLGYPAMGNVVSLVSDFTGAGNAGNRLWLAKGTLGASDGEYIPICDTESNLANCLRTTDSVRSIYAVFVDHGNKRLVWDQENPAHVAAGEPTKATYYIATSTGRLIPVTYYASAGAVFGKLTCPNAASASTTNDIIGANTGTATEILTSRSACFINIDA